MNADHGAGELVEARQYVLEEVAADRDLTRLYHILLSVLKRIAEPLT